MRSNPLEMYYSTIFILGLITCINPIKMEVKTSPPGLVLFSDEFVKVMSYLNGSDGTSIRLKFHKHILWLNPRFHLLQCPEVMMRIMNDNLKCPKVSAEFELYPNIIRAISNEDWIYEKTSARIIITSCILLKT